MSRGASERYDSSVGQTTQRDPIGLAGGVNQYGYAGGDPVNFSDPFGLCVTCGVAQAATAAYLNRQIDVSLANNQSWDNVAPSVRQGIHMAAAVSGINSVGVSWTTGGRHGESSRHYPEVHGVGKAADIYSLDGAAVGSAGGEQREAAFQAALEHAPGRRENFGPSKVNKSGKPYCTDGSPACQSLVKSHQNHIHYSVDK